MTEGGYDAIDPIIEAWVARHRFTLFTAVEGDDRACRAVYLSSGSECCQIWIDPPTADGVGLHAADIETRDDEAFRQDWFVEVPQLASALDEAVHGVRRWMDRRR